MEFHHSTSNGTSYLLAGIVYTKLLLRFAHFYLLRTNKRWRLLLRVSLRRDDWPRLIAFINYILSRKRQSRTSIVVFFDTQEQCAVFSYEGPSATFPSKLINIRVTVLLRYLILSSDDRSVETDVTRFAFLKKNIFMLQMYRQ